MSRRTRKFVGALAMLVFVIVYALVAMSVAQAKPLQQASWIVQAVVYGLIGMAWILPLMPLISWMEKGGVD